MPAFVYEIKTYLPKEVREESAIVINPPVLVCVGDLVSVYNRNNQSKVGVVEKIEWNGFLIGGEFIAKSSMDAVRVEKRYNA